MGCRHLLQTKSLWKMHSIKRNNVEMAYNGNEALTFLQTKIWEIVPGYITKSNSFNEF